MLPTRFIGRRAWMPTVFDALFDNDWNSRFPMETTSTPSINILEDENLYKVEVAAPGMTKEDFKVTLNDNGDLVVDIEKKTSEQQEDKFHFLRKEFSYTKFQQTLLLPDNARREDITAKVENGVLTIGIPKLEPQKQEPVSKNIEIS